MNIREVRIHRADPITNADAVEPVLIRIDSEQPTASYGDPAWQTATTEMFKADGKALADAIFDACPDGTVSELIAELLERRACHFRVKFPQEANR